MATARWCRSPGRLRGRARRRHHDTCRGRRARAGAVAGQGAGVGRTPGGAGPRRDRGRSRRVVRAARRRGRAARPRRLVCLLDLHRRRSRTGGAPAGVPAARRGRRRPARRPGPPLRDRARDLRGVGRRAAGRDRRADARLHGVRLPHPGPDLRRDVPADARPPRGRGAAGRRLVPRPGRHAQRPRPVGHRDGVPGAAAPPARGRHDDRRRHRCVLALGHPRTSPRPT